jgi:hypothetical protein
MTAWAAPVWDEIGATWGHSGAIEGPQTAANETPAED